PRRPVSSAWPVHCATTFTSTPVLALNSGKIWPNSPESCVEVVEETTIDFSAFARAGETASRATKAPKTVSSRDILESSVRVEITQCGRQAAMLCRDRASMAFAQWEPNG